MLWDHICGPLLTETSLCGAWLCICCICICWSICIYSHTYYLTYIHTYTHTHTHNHTHTHTPHTHIHMLCNPLLQCAPAHSNKPEQSTKSIAALQSTCFGGTSTVSDNTRTLKTFLWFWSYLWRFLSSRNMLHFKSTSHETMLGRLLYIYCVRVCLVRLPVWAFVYLYMYMFVYVYVYIYMYIHIQTCTYINIRRPRRGVQV